MATYKAIVRPILNYAAPIWFTQVPSSHLDKLEVIQNKILRAHLELCSQQLLYASALQPLHPSHLIVRFVTSPPEPRHHRATLQASYHRILRGLRVRSDDPNAPPLIFGGVLEEGAYPLARRVLRGRMIKDIVLSQAPNKVLMATPLPINPTEQLLPPSYPSTLSQLRSGSCSRLSVLPPFRRLGP